jgi:predicted nucleic acid-binding protein
LIRVDTSVWIDHLRAGDARLAALLERNQVAMHPMVAGELACGTLRDRDALLGLWSSLPQLPAASHDETLYFLAHNRLWGRGIGYVDLHLLAAVSLGDAVALWTRDKRLSQIAGQLGLAAQPDG